MKKAILFSSLIIVGLFFAIGAEGAFYNYETFDTLGSTTIDHYGYWLGPSYTQPTPGGSGTSTWLHYQFGFSPDNTVYNPGTTTYDKLEYSFWFYATSQTFADFYIGTDNPFGSDCNETIGFSLHNPEYYFYVDSACSHSTSTIIGNFATGTWYAVQIIKDEKFCDLYINSVFVESLDCDFDIKAQVAYYTDGAFDGPFIDNISLYAYTVGESETTRYGWYTSGDETLFFPIQPVDCKYNYTNDYDTTTMTFPLIGHFTNAPSSTINWYEMWVEFSKKDGTVASNSISNLTGTSTPNSDVGWATSVTIAVGTWRIDYFANGYDIYNYSQTKMSSKYCESSIGTSTTPDLENIGWWNTSEYLECQNAFQTCIDSATGTIAEKVLQNMVCGFKGVMYELFCPSPEAVYKMNAIINQIKASFPYSYIKATKDMGTNLETAATSTTATTSILGQDTGQDLDDFSGLTDIYVVSGANPITTLRTWVGYIMWFVFGIWIIKYVAKEFFT